MIFKDSESNDILKYKIVDYETNIEYKAWVKELQNEWWIIKAIVSDWRKWLLGSFNDMNIPTQMCQFHQVAIIRRYITKNPKLQANIDLKYIAYMLTRTDKETFIWLLDEYYNNHTSFIKEKALDKEWKQYFVHRKTRSAFYSLKRNLHYLFTYYDYLWYINIPNTTNWLEGLFWHIKPKLAIHRGLKKERLVKLTLSLIHGKK